MTTTADFELRAVDAALAAAGTPPPPEEEPATAAFEPPLVDLVVFFTPVDLPLPLLPPVVVVVVGLRCWTGGSEGKSTGAGGGTKTCTTGGEYLSLPSYTRSLVERQRWRMRDMSRIPPAARTVPLDEEAGLGGG